MTNNQPSVYNLANQLTASRLLLSVALFVFIEIHQWLACLAVFIIAAITDWLDGVVARKQNLVSSLGRMFDPLVDKVMVCGAFVLLLDDLAGFLWPWMVVLVVSREFIVTGIRGFMEQQGIEFGADKLGKIKMGLQCVALIAAFVILALRRWEYSVDANISGVILHAVMWAMVIATALSGAQYIWQAARKLK